MADMQKVYNKCRSPLKILGARRETRIKFHYEDPKILGVKAEHLVAMATWRLGFVSLGYAMYLHGVVFQNLDQKHRFGSFNELDSSRDQIASISY
jgi:hypothetical protein